MKGVLLNRKELGELEKFILDEVEAVIFSTRRSKPKVKGGNYIEDNTGDLRRKLRSNRNFIKQDAKGNLQIDLKMKEYYKYLDDGRRDELNWYLDEAIFESKVIRDKIREIVAKAAKRVIIKTISKETK